MDSGEPSAILATGTLASMRELERVLVAGGLHPRIVSGEGAPKSS